ncbi:hypothetical protein [Cellvibrio sp.]|uniref:hypothetical protein n=1 Tax=Cellvibrio sp. TaxID=1965322 RepID=UPI0039647A1A
MKRILRFIFFISMSASSYADLERGINNYRAVATNTKLYSSLSAPELIEVKKVITMIDSGLLIVPGIPFVPSQKELNDGKKAAHYYASASMINETRPDPCILANLNAGDSMRGDGAARGGFQSCIIGGGAIVGSTYKIQAVSSDSAVFVIANTAYFAVTPCLGLKEDQDVKFIPDAYSGCRGRTFKSVDTEILCRLKCQ